MHIHVIYMISLLTTLTLSQQPTPTTQKDFISLQGQILSQQAKQNEDRQQKIPSFIIDQLKYAKNHQQTYKQAESFIISIKSSQKFEFRYKIQSNLNPTMIIKIYTQETQDDITIIKEHSVDRYLEVFSSTNLFGIFNNVQLGSHSQGQLFIRLQNKFQIDILAQISLSGSPLKIDGFNAVKNQHFREVAKKLQAISGEMREVQGMSRKKFKFEWGFLQRQQHYEEEMLKLTGVQTVIILATAIVQIYCIKSLIDNTQTII